MCTQLRVAQQQMLTPLQIHEKRYQSSKPSPRQEHIRPGFSASSQSTLKSRRPDTVKIFINCTNGFIITYNTKGKIRRSGIKHDETLKEKKETGKK